MEDPGPSPIAAAAATPLFPDLSPWISASRQFVHNWVIDKTTIPGRTLLRLAYAGANLGAGPVELRGGSVNPNGTQNVLQRVFNNDGTWTDHLAGTFIYHAEHDHIHFEEFAQFSVRALSLSGGVGPIVAGGEKTSFCLLDSLDYDTPPVPGAPSSAVYESCDNVRQGISVGWADVYGKHLEGQTIDVTGLPNGTYWLEVEADPLNRFVESNESNNVSRIKIDLHLSDDNLAAAYNTGVLGPAQVYNEYVGTDDTSDYYTFTLNATATVSLVLKDLYANANLQLLSSSGTLIQQSANSGTASESITRSLAAGTYFARAVRSSGNTTYTLEIKDTAAAAPGTINGTAGDDTITLRRNAINASLVDVFLSGASPAYSFNADHLLAGTAQVLSGGGDDQLIVDFANGAPAPGGGISFNGGAHSGSGDLLVLTGTSATETATFTRTHFDLGATSVTHNGVERFRFAGAGGNDTLNIDEGVYRFWDNAPQATNLAVNVAAGATAIFDAAQQLQSLTISGQAELTAGVATTLVTDTLAISGTGQLDLKDSDLIVHDSPLGSWNGSTYTGVTGYIESGRNGGAWNGGGIVTSMADLGDGVTRTIGVGEASQLLGISGTATATWAGVTVDAASVIIKYTYAGDLDLDGDIDGDDYFFFDSNIAQSGTVFGYGVGDIDLDGDIDGDDYFWIDGNMSVQPPPL